MKKKLISIIFSLIMVLTTISQTNTGKVNAIEKPSLSYQAAVAYKSVIDDAIKKYGEYTVRQYISSGVGLARLIDFDGNGSLELIIGVGHNVQADEYFYEVYAYDDNLILLTHTECCNSFELGFDMRLEKSGNNVYAVTSDGSICDSRSYYGTVKNKTWVVTEYYEHEAGFCEPEWCPNAGKDIYKINGQVSSGYETLDSKYTSYDEDSTSDFVRYGEKGLVSTFNTLNSTIEQSSNKTLNAITGTLSERYVKHGFGFDVSCLILTLDTPQDFETTDIFGEKFTATNVAEIQVVAENYTSDMDGAKVKITSYDDFFEGHTAYHIRPIVITGAMLEIADKEIAVTLDGKKIIFDQPPIIVDDRTLVPLRAIFEELGATVDWNGNTQTVTSTKGNITISMSIGKTEMYKNGEIITLDVAPQLVGERTLVPARAVAEAFNCKVDWDANNREVIIKS